jgi:hypothetical protein
MTFNVLANYNGGPAGTHTITLSSAPTQGSLYVLMSSQATASFTSDNANWVQVYQYLNDRDIRLMRLDQANYGGSKTSITITISNSACDLVAVVWEDTIDSSVTPYNQPYNGNLPNGSGLWGTNLSSPTAGTDRVIAFWVAAWNTSMGDRSANDLTAYDKGVSEKADTGYRSNATYGSMRIWVAEADTFTPWTNDGVVATQSSAWDLLSGGSLVGVYAYKAGTAGGGGSGDVADSVGITDNVSAVLTSPSSGGLNLEALAQYKSAGSGATTHTINLSHAPNLNTLYLVAISAGMMTVDGGTGGWVQVSSNVNIADQKIWRLDNPSTSKTSITITSTNPVSVAAIAFQAHIDTGVTPYFAPYTNVLTGRNGLGTIGTGLHTYSGETASLAYFSVRGNSGVLVENDIGNYDQGFTSFAKTGIARSSYGDEQLWLAVNTATGSMSNNGVTASTVNTWDSGDDSFGGMIALPLLPAPGGVQNYDNLGITDSVSVAKNVVRAPADNVGISDNLAVDSNGVKNVTISDSLGITDVASKTFNPAGGSTQNSLRVLAAYADTTGLLSRTISLSQVPTLNSLYVLANSASIMSMSSDNVNWQQVSSFVDSNDFKIWRLDSANYGTSKSSVTITTSVATTVAAVIFEAEVDLSYAGNYFDPFKYPTTPGSGLWGTGLHSFSGVTDAFAVYFMENYQATSSLFDVVSYDQGFTELADSGFAPASGYNAAEIWVAHNTVTDFVNLGVQANTTVNDVAAVSGSSSRSGMFALKLLPTSAPLSASPSDNIGITDTVNAQLNANPFNQTKVDSVGIADSLTLSGSRSITIADSVGITDAARRVGLSPTIAEENANATGVQDYTWWGQGVEASTDIVAFARSTYYLPGQTAQFSVASGSAFTFEVWRMGYYGGGNRNARKVYTGTGPATSQPVPATIPNSNGANDCSNWSVNATWTVPDDATPGWYYVLMYDTAGRSQFGWFMFCVSDKLDKKDMVIVSSESTWMGAYNYFGNNPPYTGGPSLYGNGGPMTGGTNVRAYAVSLDRPVVTRVGIPQTHFFNSEYPFNRFIERMGFNVGYATNEQVENDPSILDGRKIVVFNGHNEYTSQTLHDKLRELTSTTQLKIINMGGNDFFWRIRYGTLDGSDTATKGRVIWCRKDTMDGPSGTGHVGGTPIVAGDWGGTWQDTRWDSGSHSFSDLMGDRFTRNGIANESIKIPFAYKGLPIWRDCTAVQSLTSGQVVDLGAGTAGMEWDSPLPAGQGPPRVALSEATYTISGVSDVNGQDYSLTETITHSLQMVRTAANGFILNGSTTQWAWGLDDYHDRGTAIASVTARQATLNLIYDFGVVTDDESLITGLGLTVPTPVSDIGTAYGVPANTGGGSFTKPDSVGILDTVTTDIIRVYDISITDSVGAADAPAGPRDMPRALAESLGITDVSTFTKDLNRSVADVLGITDNLTSSGISTKSVNLSDALGITDTYLINRGYSRSLTDGVNIGDSASGAIAVPKAKTIADVFGITDALARTMAASRTQVDSVGLTDYIYAYKFVPGSTQSFYWDGSSELPMTMTIWTGAAETGVTVEGSV